MGCCQKGCPIRPPYLRQTEIPSSPSLEAGRWVSCKSDQQKGLRGYLRCPCSAQQHSSEQPWSQRSAGGGTELFQQLSGPSSILPQIKELFLMLSSVDRCHSRLLKPFVTLEQAGGAVVKSHGNLWIWFLATSNWFQITVHKNDFCLKSIIQLHIK